MKENKSTPGELVLRGITFSYVGLLIILPVIAISFKAFDGGIARLWQDITLPQALFSLKITLVLAVTIAIINVITGTATAWVLVRCDFPFKREINALIDLPFAIPTIVTGIMLVALYGPRSFIGMFLQNKFNLEVVYNSPGILIALLFVTFPFVVRCVQPVLQEMEKEVEEAALTMGASPLQVFFKVILPTLFPSIVTGAALSFSRALGEFGSVVIVAGNIPFKTQMAAVYVYGEIESYNTSGATGVSFVLLAFSFLVLVFLNFIQFWSRRNESR
jgi:sulfate/thiosulfate transport system permease protein